MAASNVKIYSSTLLTTESTGFQECLQWSTLKISFHSDSNATLKVYFQENRSETTPAYHVDTFAYNAESSFHRIVTVKGRLYKVDVIDSVDATYQELHIYGSTSTDRFLNSETDSITITNMDMPLGSVQQDTYNLLSGMDTKLNLLTTRVRTPVSTSIVASASVTAGAMGSSVDMDGYLYAAATISTAGVTTSGSIYMEYSPDNSSWFRTTDSAFISSSGTTMIRSNYPVCARYVRLYADGTISLTGVTALILRGG